MQYNSKKITPFSNSNLERQSILFLLFFPKKGGKGDGRACVRTYTQLAMLYSGATEGEANGTLFSTKFDKNSN